MLTMLNAAEATPGMAATAGIRFKYRLSIDNKICKNILFILADPKSSTKQRN